MHIKHTDGHFEKVPYFCLPANDLTEVIAPSCYACFDYPNALADLVRLGCKASGTLEHAAKGVKAGGPVCLPYWQSNMAIWCSRVIQHAQGGKLSA